MKRNKKGQSVVEFALVSVIFVFMLSMTFNAAIAFTVYQYLSYATFMSARALQSSKSNQFSQTQAAEATMAGYIPNWSKGSNNFALKFPNFSKSVTTIKNIYIPDAADIPQGVKSVLDPKNRVRIEFSVDLLPIGLFDSLSAFRTIDLVVDSGLGREVTKAECKTFFRKFFDSTAGHIENYKDAPGLVSSGEQLEPADFMEDNGC